VANVHRPLPVEVAALLLELERAVGALLEADGIPPGRRDTFCSAHLRYRGQSFELAVAHPTADDLAARFHEAHRARYGFALPERTVELVTLRVRGVGRTPPIAPPREPAEEGEPEVGRLLSRWDGAAHATPILARARLRDGARVEGPALIVEYSATTWVAPGWVAVSDGGCLRLSLG
jgi:N-methylhydantoinase A